MKVTISSRKLTQLSHIPNVIGIHKLTPKSFDNIHGVPLIGAPEVWAGIAGVGAFAGEGIKVAVIDTGVDYTHADFGGPGTTAAYEAAHAAEALPADPSLFGPLAPRVKGGTDLVGDSYNADPTDPAFQPVPHPDPNPLDCNGHGSHTTGTAAGSGVLSDGSTYTGPYNASTISSHSWNVGPGVAPKADIYGVRVFGCAGSTDVVVDAIEWAVNHGMDVINMSLGSPYGGADDPDAVAANNAADAGTIVVTSTGNSGPNPYLAGSPGTATNVISTAANDPTVSFPAANVALSTGTTLQAINANDAPLPGGALPVKVLFNPGGHTAANISLGCDPAEYTAAGVTGAIVVVKRGTCARVARAIFGEQAGAAAVLMVNNANVFPPFEGAITENPDDGQQFTVTIPFLGVPLGNAAALVAADGGTATLTGTTLANPGALATASFSSGGPRTGDSALKPDITGPGVSIASAGVGTGNGPAILSGTSMASPHVAGEAALVRQAHPSWGQVKYWKAAIVNTADPSLVSDYTTRLNGAGLVQVPSAVKTQVVATATSDTASLSYGFADLTSEFNKTQQVTLRNFSNQAITFTTGHTRDAGSPHSVAVSASSVKVPANGTAKLSVTLRVPAATAGAGSDLSDVAGLLRLTPTGGANRGVALSVPYYLVPRASSDVKVTLNMNVLKKKGTALATMTNYGAAVGGVADWYSWGVSDAKDAGIGSNDIQAVGVQTFPDDGIIAFGLSTWKRWSNAAANEYDIYVDVNGDDDPDYVVVEADLGLLTTGSSDGEPAVAVFDLETGDGSINFLADAPTDSTTMVLPVLIDQLCTTASACLSAANPRITYYAVGFANGPTDEPESVGTFNVFHPSVDNGMFIPVGLNTTVSQQVNIDKAEFAHTPGLGVMVISHDNKADREATLLGY
jgi:minor extracellular serine protease Vpr